MSVRQPNAPTRMFTVVLFVTVLPTGNRRKVRHYQNEEIMVIHRTENQIETEEHHSRRGVGAIPVTRLSKHA